MDIRMTKRISFKGAIQESELKICREMLTVVRPWWSLNALAFSPQSGHKLNLHAEVLLG
jgi:hypothetical protein